MVSDPIPMKRDRLHVYRILANEFLKSIKNTEQKTTQPNSINRIQPITNENAPMK